MIKWIQNKLERLGIAYRKKYYAPDNLYEYAIDVSVEKSQTLPVRILKGKYAGVVYCYDTIKIGDDRVDGSVDATYNINVIQFTEKLREDYYKDKKFLKVVGNILLSIFWETIRYEEESKKGKVDDESREDYFEEPHVRRTVHSKDSPVH